ncbi:MAG: DUF1538 domain-containing protein [Eubacteriales bacterium]
MNIIVEKFKEVLTSVVPIVFIVLLLNFTVVPLPGEELIVFVIASVFLVIGLSGFLIGVEVGISPIGDHMGEGLARSGKLWIVLLIGLFLGFLISIAEPDLHIVANQVSEVSCGLISKMSIVLVVSIGIAIMLAIGLARIMYNIPLYIILATLYVIILILAFFTSKDFIAISFDASGATTGALTVPFVLSLALGTSKLKMDSKASEKDSFGLVAIVSTGAIIAVMLMSIVKKTDKISGELPVTELSGDISDRFFHIFVQTVPEVATALFPVIFLFFVFNFVLLKLNRRELRKITVGVIFTFLGLVIFLTGVNAGFMRVGSIIGESIASKGNLTYPVILAFILGFVTILAEPAVYVLTHQIEEVTSGYVKRLLVLATLAVGVGIAVALAVLRIMIPGLQLWQFLLPGYIIATLLMFIAPKLFVGIAYDSGGVASGPMTATFILAYTQGIASATPTADVFSDGFGVIAMVAMTPLIALQLLGILFKIKSKKDGI